MFCFVFSFPLFIISCQIPLVLTPSISLDCWSCHVHISPVDHICLFPWVSVLMALLSAEHFVVPLGACQLTVQTLGPRAGGTAPGLCGLTSSSSSALITLHTWFHWISSVSRVNCFLLEHAVTACSVLAAFLLYH